MMFRMMMLRGRPRTTLCASLQSKCTSTFQKGYLLQKFKGKMPRPRTRDHTLCEPAVEMHFTVSQEPLYTGKMRGPE